MGKLIVFEGLDGSGKSTQLNNLKRYLSKNGILYKQIKLPDYEHDSSILVRNYLNGDYGSKPDDVNAYAASSLFAVDRFASFKLFWGKDYNNGSLILADRYTTSNAALQCSKLPKEQWDEYLEWLYDFEFNKIGIPKPDVVLFFDMLPEISQKLLSKRYNGVESKKDIHERDREYLERCRTASLYSAQKLGWTVIKCYDGDMPRPIDDIFCEVSAIVSKLIKGE